MNVMLAKKESKGEKQLTCVIYMNQFPIMEAIIMNCEHVAI